MGLFRNIVGSFLGVPVHVASRWLPRATAYVLLLLFFTLQAYFGTSARERLIVSGVLAGLVFATELTLFLLNAAINASVELSDSAPDDEPERPGDIPPEIWQLRSVLLAPATRAAAVEDLIGSGVDLSALLALVRFMERTSYGAVERVPRARQANLIGVCGRYWSLPFSRQSLSAVFPVDHSWLYAIAAGAGTYLAAALGLWVLGARPFSRYDRWWGAAVLSGAVASVVWRPEREPFSAAADDAWAGLGRAVAVVALAGARAAAAALEGGALEVAGLRIELSWAAPYVCDIAYWGLVLLPFWLFAGFVGHPAGVALAAVEAFNRYAFGQSGVVGFRHMALQAARGAAAAAAAWGALAHAGADIALPAAAAAATLLGALPVWWAQEQREAWWAALGWPLACAGTAFWLPYALARAGDAARASAAVGAAVWCGACDLLLPLLSSYNRFGFVHARLYCGPVRAVPAVRGLTQLVALPLAVAAGLRGPAPAPVVALAVVHAVQKAHTEPHVFAVAQILALATLSREFAVAGATPAFVLALLIAAKAEVLLPLLHFFARSRGTLARPGDEDPCFAPLLHVFVANVLLHPGPDWWLKLPSFAWSALTGASLSVITGVPWLAAPGAPRPFRFFEFAPGSLPDMHALLARSLAEHPVEAPVYTSAVAGLARGFAPLARAGLLGLVTCGDMFVFQSGEFLLLAHVVAIEPTCFRVQVRGLPYAGQAAARRSGPEAEALTGFARDESACRRANRAVMGAAELRQRELPLRIYDAAETPLDGAFLTVTGADCFEWFAFAFCRIAARAGLRAGDLQAPCNAYRPRVQRAVALEPRLARLLALLGAERPPEDVHALAVFWGSVSLAFFTDSGVLDTAPLLAAFRGSFDLPQDLAWVYSVNGLFANVVIPAVRLGITYVYLASAAMAPLRDQPEDDFLREVADWGGAESEILVVPTGSKEFEDALFRSERPLLSLEPPRPGWPAAVMVRFALVDKEWDVFRLDHEFVRALWSNERRGVLFYENARPARFAIQPNHKFFNQTIIEFCDPPVGDPALVSPCLVSLINPWKC
jgi:hypothetical protein